VIGITAKQFPAQKVQQVVREIKIVKSTRNLARRGSTPNTQYIKDDSNTLLVTSFSQGPDNLLSPKVLSPAVRQHRVSDPFVSVRLRKYPRLMLRLQEM
jgi:hypothetical protein